MNNQVKELTRVVVVGGGFAGINVVKGLKNMPAAITLVDKHNYHVFQPLLYQVATAELSPEEIAAPIRRIVRSQKNVTVALVELIDVDLEQKLVRGRHGERGYDYLVLATGVQPAYFGHDEYRHLAPGLKNLDDAIEIRRRILIAFEEAEFEADELSRQGKLTFVVVGGGPTGVELAGAIMETATRTLPREFHNIDTTTTRVLLVQGGESLLPGMPDEMGQLAQHNLEEMGIEVRLNSLVTEVNDLGVVISDEHVPAENVFWAAGVQGMPIAESMGVELDRSGRIVVGPDLSIPGFPEVFVIGDAASATDAATGMQVPGVAQGAIQMGQFVAKIIGQELQGSDSQERPAFSYRDKGSMATIGRGKALASVNGRTFSGFLGWLAWGMVHLLYLVSFRNKVSVLLEWGRNYLVSERSARLITGDPELKIKRIRGARMTDNQGN
jgi:NADH dehydrogenase